MTQAHETGPQENTGSLSLKLLAINSLVLGCITFGADWLNSSSWTSGSISILWPSTGLLIGMILCLPRRQWPIYIAVGFLIDVIANVLPPLREPFPLCVNLAACNALEVLVAGWLLRQTFKPRQFLTRPEQLISLLINGVILAPAAASFLASLLVWSAGQKPLLKAFADWYMADALGIAIVTPLYLSLRGRSPLSSRSAYEVPALFALLCTVSVSVFWQTGLPLLFVILPVLMLIGVRLGMAGSSLGLLAVSVIGGFFTARGRGPIALPHLATLSQRTLVLQAFTMVCMLMLYIAEVLRSERSRFEHDVLASEQRFRLLAEGLRDIITLSNLKLEVEYVSPSVESLLGWDARDWEQLGICLAAHPDDEAKLRLLYEHCLSGSVHNTLDFRCRMKNGGYIWLEASLVLQRDPETAAPIGFINVMRDISERKAAEEALNRALNVAENRANKDALTGVANRRSFDESMENEWRRAMRAGTSLSMLMIDVDFFKNYNDRYGHLAGDYCLKEIAGEISFGVQRHGDFVARYGGEEFVVVLPGTSLKGAYAVAEHMRRAVLQRRVPHEGVAEGFVTISVGCAIHSPLPGSHYTELVKSADDALYLAKSAGRNCVRLAAEEDTLTLEPVP